MEDVQNSANQETKSSAGDKYETGRAMMQQEKDKYALQLEQALELQQQLEHLDPAITHQEIQVGSLIRTNEGYYYLAVSLGKVKVEQNTVYVLSAAAPLGLALLHKRMGDKLVFQQRTIQVIELA
jgi:transcription elongation GreA/GreB family factor